MIRPMTPRPSATSRPRLVATDLDGTLVRSDGTVSAYTREVLEELDRRGVPVVFVTGRPLRWAEDVFEYVGGHGLAIVSNGGLVWDVARSDVHLLRPIEPRVGLEVCALIRDAVPGSAFAVESLSGIALEDGFLERHPLPEEARRGSIEELFEETSVKLLVRHEELPAEEFWDRVMLAVGDRVVVTWSSTSALLEISGAGVTKASTLALLCADHGVAAEDVIAFGDMPNDLPLLGWAGTSYAMADAHPLVTAAADRVAPGHDDDGVARVLAGVFDL
jgi:Cof subfamily protein (haloacid dehalogenase superfamily)